MTMLGIWSDGAGGIIESQFYSETEAATRIDELVEEGEDRDDLKVMEVCPQHCDDPVDDCPECEDEDDEEEEL